MEQSANYADRLGSSITKNYTDRTTHFFIFLRRKSNEKNRNHHGQRQRPANRNKSNRYAQEP